MHCQEMMPLLRRNNPLYRHQHIMRIPRLYTNLEVPKCPPTRYPPPFQLLISQQLYSLNPSQHVWGEDGSVGIWVVYPCACAVTAPDWMTQGQSDAWELDARLYGWVLLPIVLEFWKIVMVHIVPPSMRWVRGCTTKIMDLRGLHINKEVPAVIGTQ